jgi:ribosomal-protein-alanine N-acetyltransferase
LQHQEKHGYGLFAVILRSTRELIGDCGLENSDFTGRPCLEIGYDFLSAYWNQGYATEAALRVRDFAMDNLGIAQGSLCSFIRQSNVGSQHVSEKIGMHRLLMYEKWNTQYYLYGFGDELLKVSYGT